MILVKHWINIWFNKNWITGLTSPSLHIAYDMQTSFPQNYFKNSELGLIQLQWVRTSYFPDSNKTKLKQINFENTPTPPLFFLPVFNMNNFCLKQNIKNNEIKNLQCPFNVLTHNCNDSAYSILIFTCLYQRVNDKDSLLKVQSFCCFKASDTKEQNKFANLLYHLWTAKMYT